MRRLVGLVIGMLALALASGALARSAPPSTNYVDCGAAELATEAEFFGFDVQDGQADLPAAVEPVVLTYRPDLADSPTTVEEESPNLVWVTVWDEDRPVIRVSLRQVSALWFVQGFTACEPESATSSKTDTA